MNLLWTHLRNCKIISSTTSVSFVMNCMFPCTGLNLLTSKLERFWRNQFWKTRRFILILVAIRMLKMNSYIHLQQNLHVLGLPELMVHPRRELEPVSFRSQSSSLFLMSRKFPMLLFPFCTTLRARRAKEKMKILSGESFRLDLLDLSHLHLRKLSFI